MGSRPSKTGQDDHPETSRSNHPGKKQTSKGGSLQEAAPAPTPKLRLQFEDLTHAGSKVFLEYIPDPHGAFTRALTDIVAYLYTSPPCNNPDEGDTCPVHFEPSPPPTLSVTLILRDFSGVAYTVGSSADSNIKEIHFSLSYIAGRTHLADPAAELIGVMTHELVHCYQHSGKPRGSPGDVPRAPSGLIEGVADFVRLKAGLVPPHWKRPLNSTDLPAKWDVGYQQTAFFFEWLEDVRVGMGAVGMLNDRLLREGYGEGFWVGLFDVDVLELWQEYGTYLDQSNATALPN